MLRQEEAKAATDWGMLAHLSGKGKRWQLTGVHVLGQAGGDSPCWKPLPVLAEAGAGV